MSISSPAATQPQPRQSDSSACSILLQNPRTACRDFLFVQQTIKQKAVLSEVFAGQGEGSSTFWQKGFLILLETKVSSQEMANFTLLLVMKIVMTFPTPTILRSVKLQRQNVKMSLYKL